MLFEASFLVGIIADFSDLKTRIYTGKRAKTCDFCKFLPVCDFVTHYNLDK